MVEEETKAMLDDSPEMITEEIDILAKLKKMLDSQEKGEDDEVLQTKIISFLRSQRTGMIGFRQWMLKSRHC